MKFFNKVFFLIFLNCFSYLFIKGSGSIEKFQGADVSFNVDAVAWRPGNSVSDPYKNYVAAGGTSNDLKIYSLDTSSTGNSFQLLDSDSDFVGSQVNALDWEWRKTTDPYLIVGVDNESSGNAIYVYDFNLNTTSLSKKQSYNFSDHEYWPYLDQYCGSNPTVVYDLSCGKVGSNSYVAAVAKVPNKRLWTRLVSSYWNELRIFKINDGTGVLESKDYKVFKNKKHHRIIELTDLLSLLGSEIGELNSWFVWEKVFTELVFGAWGRGSIQFDYNDLEDLLNLDGFWDWLLTKGFSVLFNAFNFDWLLSYCDSNFSLGTFFDLFDQDLLNAALNLVRSNMDGTRGWWDDLLDDIVDLWDDFAGFITSLWGSVQGFIDALGTLGITTLSALCSFLELSAEDFFGLFKFNDFFNWVSSNVIGSLPVRLADEKSEFTRGRSAASNFKNLFGGSQLFDWLEDLAIAALSELCDLIDLNAVVDLIATKVDDVLSSDLFEWFSLPEPFVSHGWDELGVWSSKEVSTVKWNPTSGFIAVAGTGASVRDWEDPLQGLLFPMNVKDYFGLGEDEAEDDIVERENNIVVYDFDGTSLTYKNGVSFEPSNLAFSSLDWSPDGKYLAIGVNEAVAGIVLPYSSMCYVYEVNSSDGQFTFKDSYALTGTIDSVSWKKSDYILVGLNLDLNSYGIHAYKNVALSFDGTSLEQAASTDLSYTLSINSVDWSHGGRYGVAGCKFGTGTELNAIDFISPAEEDLDSIKTIGWRPGVWDTTSSELTSTIAVGGDKKAFKIYSYNGSSATELGSSHSRCISNETGIFVNSASVNSLTWSTNGKYLAVAGENNSVDFPDLLIYSFEDHGDIPAKQFSEAFWGGSWDNRYNYGANIRGVDWNKPSNLDDDPTYLSIVGEYDSSHEVLTVYQLTGSSLITKDTEDYGTNGPANCVSWRPGQNQILVGGFNIDGSSEIILYDFDGSSLSVSCTKEFTGVSGKAIRTIDWHPSGNYVAVAFIDRVYVFNTSLDYILTSSYLQLSDGAHYINDLKWDLEGEFLLVGLENDPEIKICEFDITTTPTLTLFQSDSSYSNEVKSVDWSIGSRYRVVGGLESGVPYVAEIEYTETVTLVKVDTADCNPENSCIAAGEDKKTLEIYSVSGETVSLLGAGNVSNEDTATINEVCWSPCSRYIAVGLKPDNGDYAPLRIYEFDGTTTTTKTQSYCNSSWSFRNSDSGMITSIDWNTPDNPMVDTLYISAIGNCINDSVGLVIHSLNANTLSILTTTIFDNLPAFVRWQRYTNYLAVGGYNIDGTKDLKIYKFDSSEESVTEVFGESLWGSSPGASSFDWSPDNSYFSVSSTNTLYIGHFDTSNSDSWNYSCADVSVDCGATINFVQWSNNGLYIIVGCDNGVTSEVQVYFFDGRSTIQLVDNKEYSGSVNSVGWSKDDWYYYWAGDAEVEVFVEKNDFERTWTGVIGHSVSKSVIAFSPNENALAILNNSGECKLLNFHSEVVEEISTATIAFEESTHGVFFDISPNGNYIAVVDQVAEEMQLYDATDDELVFLSSTTLTTSDDIYYVDWSPNGNYVALSGSTNCSIYVYKLNGTSFNQVIELDVGIGTARQVKWSPDGRHIAFCRVLSSTDNNDLMIYQFNNDSLIEVDTVNLGTSPDYLFSVDWSPNGNYIALAGAELESPDANELKIYSFDGNSLSHITSYNTQSLLCVSWNPDSKYLIAGEFDGSAPYKAHLFYFDGSTITSKYEFVKDGTVSDIRWDSQGRYVIIGHGDQEIETADSFYVCEFNRSAETLDEIQSSTVFTDVNYYSTVRWFPDGDKFAVAGYSDLKMYDWDGVPLCKASELNLDVSYARYIESIKWSPDGNYLAVAMYQEDSVGVDVYKFDSNKTLTLFHGAQVDYGTAACSVDWSFDGNFLAVGGVFPSSGNALQVYRFNKQSSLVLTTSMVYGTYIRAVAWAPNENYLAVGGASPTDNHELQIYYLNENDYLETVTRKMYGNIINGITWSPDGSSLAVGGRIPDDGNELQIYEFNSTTSELIDKDGADFGDEIWSVAWSYTGNYIAIGGDSPEGDNEEIQVYHFDNGNLEFKDRVDFGTQVRTVAWASDKNCLAIGGLTSTDGYEVRVYYFDGSSLILTSQMNYGDEGQSGVFGIDWSPDGNYLAAGGYRPDSGKEIQVYPVSWDYGEISETSNVQMTIEMSDVTFNPSKGFTLENMKLRVK